MKIGIPKETGDGETRVAVIPSMISVLTKNGNVVLVEAGAGARSSFSDDQYREAGAEVVEDVEGLYGQADVVLKVMPPRINERMGVHEADLLRESSIFIGFMSPLAHPETISKFASRGITGFSMEFIPRITRAQGMDALSSMATVAGYKAVLIAANQLNKFFPLLMTAAGTITPARVLVLGAGVAGLQAIATAKRLGARVEAFDPRPAVREQVESLGAGFIEMEVPRDMETAGGYAREQSDEFLKSEQETIAAILSKMDAVITTAQVFGKKAPILITGEMAGKMRPGSVIVDLASEQGGNCALTEAGKTVAWHGVDIIGAVNLPSLVPFHSSQMYSRNITNLFKHLFPAQESALDFNDEITRGACITRNGEIVNEMVRKGRLS